MDVNVTASAADNTDLPVNGIQNYFNGDYYVGRAAAQDFIIRGKKTKSLNLTSNTASPIHAFSGGDINLNGSLNYGDNSAFVSPGVEAYISINGVDDDPVNVPVANTGDTTIDISAALSKTLTADLKAGKFNSGDNSVTYYARDSLGNKSNVQTVTVNLSDKSAVLDLNPDGYFFKDIQALYTGLVQRKGDWKVNVDSVNTAWNLSASASALTYTNPDTDKTYTFDGELVYKKNSDIKSMSDAISIGSSTSNTGSSTTIIGQNWQKNDGILLKSNGGTGAKGKYTGTISWDLVQAP